MPRVRICEGGAPGKLGSLPRMSYSFEFLGSGQILLKAEPYYFSINTVRSRSNITMVPPKDNDMVKYFYKVDQRVSGPVSASVLIDLLERAKIDLSSTLIRREDSNEWHPAGKIKINKTPPSSKKSIPPGLPEPKSIKQNLSL